MASDGATQGAATHQERYVNGADRQTLIRYVTDILAGIRTTMRVYDSAIDHAREEEAQVRLGEFKADHARTYELGRIAVRSLGGDARPAKEAAAVLGTAFTTMLMSMTRDRYNEAREIKNLVGAERMARFDFAETLHLSETLGLDSLRRFSQEGLASTTRHLEYLEPRAKETLERALFEPAASGGAPPSASEVPREESPSGPAGP